MPGAVRFPFLVIDNNAKPVERPAATVWVARSRRGTPFERVSAKLEPVGVPGRSEPAFGGVTKIYVAHLRIPTAGRYWLVAQPNGAKLQALGALDVATRSRSVAVGAGAPRSDTPTLATAPAAQITTSSPPDLPLLRYSVADSLAAHKPFVVTFATPKFCTSRTCGPVVDVVEAARRQFAARGIRFMHVEVFQEQRSDARLQPLDAPVGSHERAVGLPRRARRPGEGEVRGLGLGSRARRRHPRAPGMRGIEPIVTNRRAETQAPPLP